MSKEQEASEAWKDYFQDNDDSWISAVAGRISFKRRLMEELEKLRQPELDSRNPKVLLDEIIELIQIVRP